MVTFARVEVRTTRRLRLEFSSALAGGAFSPSWYTIVSEDSLTGNPLVAAALLVPDLANYVELALDREMADGGTYTLHLAAGIPAADASTLAATDQIFYPPTRKQDPSESLTARGLSDIIFQEDIAHDPTRGHVEAPDGDLATVTGPDNAKANVTRGLLSSGLPHRIWGASIREDVDSPGALLGQLRGKCERQIRSDDRVTDCKASVVEDGVDGTKVINADLELIGQVKTNIREALRARS